LDKIQTIERLLFYRVVASSYLLLPLGLLFMKGPRRGIFPVFIAIYGLLFSFLLFSYDFLPKGEYRRTFQICYTFFEYSVFAFLFWLNIENLRFRRFIFFFSLLFLGFLIFYYFSATLIRMDSIPVGIETILIFVYISYFFYETFKKNATFSINNHYCFWLCVGVLIYLGGSFFFYILINDLTEEQVTAFGNLTYVAEIIKNILFLIALLIYSKFPNRQMNKKQDSIPFLDLI
jgi:hypothetical protein